MESEGTYVSLRTGRAQWWARGAHRATRVGGMWREGVKT